MNEHPWQQTERDLRLSFITQPSTIKISVMCMRKQTQSGTVGLPVIDLSRKRTQVAELLVKAYEDYGFFKVIIHGVPQEVIARMEAEGQDFYSRPASAKQRAGPANPMGYGCRNIGFNGDTGSPSLSDPNLFPGTQHNSACCACSSAVTECIEAVRDLAFEILELLAEGLRIPDKNVLSRLIRDRESDSVFRMNHYPCCMEGNKERNASHRVGFGEHSDPQILKLLRSNGVGGLYISLAMLCRSVNGNSE